MNERFELNFKNKEVRVWLYLFLVTVIISVFVGSYSGMQYVIMPSVLFFISYRSWRFFYRRHQQSV